MDRCSQHGMRRRPPRHAENWRGSSHEAGPTSTLCRPQAELGFFGAASVSGQPDAFRSELTSLQIETGCSSLLLDCRRFLRVRWSCSCLTDRHRRDVISRDDKPTSQENEPLDALMQRGRAEYLYTHVPTSEEGGDTLGPVFTTERLIEVATPT